MFTDLKPYPDYRESGSRMLGLVPSGWTVRPMRTFLTARTGRNRPDLPLLSVARERGAFVRGVDDDNHNVIPEDLTGYKIALAGDLVINKMKAWQGSLGLAPCDGIVSPAYYVFEFAMSNRYFGQALLRSRPYVGEFAAASDGVRIGQWDLSVSRLRKMPVVVPPSEEQAAIVKYLGHANARIDRAIAAKRRLIALLEEQKQAVINQAVAHGLDPVVPMKDSGIPWLGPIPVHWNVRRAKYLFRDMDARSETGLEEQLSVSHLTGVTPRRLKNITMFKAASYVGHKTCRAGDLVVNTMWAWMGALGCAREAGLVSPAYNVYRPLQGSGADTEFVGALFRTPTYIAYFRSNSTGVRASRLRFYPDELLATPVVLPPRDEQAAIVLAIEDLRGRVAADLEKVVREIELLREFRTRLTADVATGQIDIRDVASRLPELDPADLVSDPGPDEDDLEAELAASLEEVDA